MPHLHPIKEIVDEVIEKQTRINRVNGFNLGSNAIQIHVNELHIALKQRDEEWQQMIEGMKKKDYGGFSGTSLTFEEIGYNQALDDLIKISKE